MESLGASLAGLDDLGDILQALRDFTHSPTFIEYAESTATKMVTHLFSDAGRTWRQAARANGLGRLIHQALMKEMQGPVGNAVRHQINRNAEIIKSLPNDIAKQVNEHVLRESLAGTRASDIAEQIKTMFPHVAKTKANLIARTETSKTSTALTRARSEAVGVDWYIWRTSQDQRVRDSHRIMSGVLVKWTSPPSPEALDKKKSYGHYHAGDTFNCRCYPEPVIDLDLIKWPALVYYGGSIQRMSRKQFERIM